MIVGYGRTSTFDQTAGLAAQERDRLKECLEFLRAGDVLMVTKRCN
jgi:DNA invertase Pin-like site-specific DNA recombinase